MPGCGFVAILLAAPWTANGQTPTTPDRGVRPLQLTDYSGYLEFKNRSREEDQKSKVGAGDTNNKETIFQESLRLDLDGYIYHPNFLEFTAGGLFGLKQSEFDQVFGNREEHSADQGPIYEFDLDGHFFKKKPYPGSVFARRYEAIEPRPFLSSLDTVTTTYGVAWQYVSEKTPTSLLCSSVT